MNRAEQQDYVTTFTHRWEAMSGYVYPQYTFLAQRDPAFAEAFLGIMTAWRRAGAIPLKYKEMMILMGSCVKMQDLAIRTHIKKCRALGATDEELLELVELVLLSGGGVAMVKAVGIFMEELGVVDTAPDGPAWPAPQSSDDS
jgi:alkylhydroperoxidase/carboxymuconolactone decarboxylase family protein YurZ